MIAQAETENQVDTNTEFLNANVVLLAPTISSWKGLYKLPTDKTKTFVSDSEVNSNEITSPQAKLLTERYPLDSTGTPWKRRFQRIESELERVKSKYSVRFPLNGVRVVPKPKVGDFLHILYGETVGSLKRKIDRLSEDTWSNRDELDQLNERYEAVAHLPPETPVFDPSRDTQSLAYTLWQTSTEFCDDLENVWAQVAAGSNVWEQVKDKVPKTKNAMLSKFSLDVVPIELATNTANTGTTADLLANSEVVRETCRRRVAEAIDEMIAEPREQLAATLANLSELIARDGRVDARSFQPVRDAIAKIRLFECVADADLLSQLDQLEDRLNITTPKTLTSATAASSGFTSAINAFRSEVEAATSRAAEMSRFGGRAPRAVKID